MIVAGSAFCHSLQDFRSGDSETGKGNQITDAAIGHLTAACPNLIHVGLDGSKNLTDMSLIAFFRNCPMIRHLAVTGNDKNSGSLEGLALDELRGKSAWGKKLKKIRLTDQHTSDKTFNNAILSLSTSRRGLPIELGCTHERDGGVDTWLGGKMKRGYQAFEGPGGFSQFGGW